MCTYLLRKYITVPINRPKSAMVLVSFDAVGNSVLFTF